MDNSNMKHLIIENIMGGVAWILAEYSDYNEAYDEYKMLKDKGNIELISLWEEELQIELDNEKLKYI